MGIIDMKYLDFLTKLKQDKFYIFNLEDIKRYFSDSSHKTIQNQLQLWTEKGLLLRLKRGIYKIQLPEGEPVLPDMYIANRIYEPSYVSLETALSFYGIIPEVAVGVTSVTTKQTKLFKNEIGWFRYRSCKRQAYCGYKIMVYEGFKIFIAEKEKAIVDFIYFKLRDGEIFNWKQERFDEEILKKLSWKKIFRYAKTFNKRTLLVVRKIREEL